MIKYPLYISCGFILFLFFGCQEKNIKEATFGTYTTHNISQVTPINHNGTVNVLIEIPAGTNDKWELNKETGELEWELKDGKPRVVNYLGYPGNYGMIPNTLLPEALGGDGDPLDVLVLGPSEKRGTIVSCKIIGVLLLEDHGEQDDKLIAVSENSPLYHINDIDQLNKEYNGITTIIETWFSNYKGPGKLVSKGFGDKDKAQTILDQAITAYNN